MRRGLLFVALTTVALSLPDRANAGGFEFPAPGTRSLGRGGAFYARADGPMALMYNPANLASLSGMQLSLDTHVAFFGACFDRKGTYDEDPNARFPTGYDGVEYPEVCNDGPPGVVPELVFTLRPHEDVGLGVGLLAPSAVGHTEWGNTGSGTVNVDVGGEKRKLPSPARYNLVRQNLLIFYPSIGIGYQPHEMVRFGATFGWGIGLVDFTNYTRAIRGHDFETDIRTRLEVDDYFIPRATVSAHVVPHDRVDVTLGFTWNDGVNGSGRLQLVSGDYKETPFEERVANCSGEAERCDRGPVDARLIADQPWKLAFGIRYAHRTSPRPEDRATVEKLSKRIEDPMANEQFDVELDLVYEGNSRVDRFTVLVPETESGGQPELDVDINAPLPPRIELPHRWKDQLSLRLGGDYNVIPGMATARLGFSFETRGLQREYAQLDFMPFMRYGLHLGFTFRLGRFDLSVAYAHIFQESITVKEEDVSEGTVEGMDVEGQVGVPQVVATNAAGAPEIVNVGTYESRFDVVSVQLRYTF